MNALSASGTGMLGPVARNAVISLTSSLASPETVSNSSEPLISDMSPEIGFSAKRSARTAQPPPDPPSWISQLQRPVALPPWRLVESVTARRTGRLGSGAMTRPKTTWRRTIEPADRPVTHMTLDLCRTRDRLVLCREATAADSKRCRRKRHRNETFCSPGPDVRDALPNNRIRSHIEEGVRLGPKRMPAGVVLDDHLPHTVSRNTGGYLGRHRVIAVLPVPGLFRALTEAGVD